MRGTKLRVSCPGSPRSAPARIFPRQQRSDLTLRRTPPPSFAAVDAWTTEHAKTFNATTFEVKFGDTVVPAVFTDAAPTVDGAWGTSPRRTSPSRLGGVSAGNGGDSGHAGHGNASGQATRWERSRRTSGCP